jgi:hypothetical protein
MICVHSMPERMGLQRKNSMAAATEAGEKQGDNCGERK